MILLLLGTLALAGDLDVEDGTGCLDSGLLGAELDEVIGPPVERLDLELRVTADGDDRRIDVEVTGPDDQGVVFDRVLTVASVDCPLAHAVVARAVHRGLDALPGWSWGTTLGPVYWVARAGGAVGTAPVMPRASLHLGASVPLARRVRAPIEATGGVTGFTTVDEGQAQLLEVGLHAGIAVEAAAPWIWPRVGLTGGTALVRGRYFAENLRSWEPRLGVRGGVDLGLAPAAGVAIDVEAPLLRQVFREVGGRSLGEPALRLGLGVVVRWR